MVLDIQASSMQFRQMLFPVSRNLGIAIRDMQGAESRVSRGSAGADANMSRDLGKFSFHRRGTRFSDPLWLYDLKAHNIWQSTSLQLL